VGFVSAFETSRSPTGYSAAEASIEDVEAATADTARAARALLKVFFFIVIFSFQINYYLCYLPPCDGRLNIRFVDLIN
jgi:hypothetical protein